MARGWEGKGEASSREKKHMMSVTKNTEHGFVAVPCVRNQICTENELGFPKTKQLTVDD
jgi:hypothetical protein